MRKLILGVNDLATLRPDLAKQWDMDKNGDILPTMVTCGSQKNIWWRCEKGHSFMSAVTTRVRMNTICPYCSNKAVLKGFNDMMTTNPELVRDWDYDKNVSLSPYEICAGTGKLIWWKCHICGGSWKAKGADRNRGVGCPFCKNKRTQKGINDLESTNPILASEWNYARNDIMPDMLVGGSRKKVWWICKECGMEWSATVDDRKRGRGCPKCNRRNQTSFPEQAIMYYILKNYPDAINGYTDIFSNSMELDVFIPSLRLGIEYDGRAWHNSEISLKREKIKYDICKKEGIFLIRIKEDDTVVDQTSDVVVLVDESLDKTILKLQKYLDISDVNTERDRQIIMSKYYNSVKERSIKVVAPQISTEWDYKKNGYLKPYMFLPNSGEKVWWICEKGHSYKTSVAHRSEGKGCPYCSNQKVLIGFNDLKTLFPDIAEEWDYEKNGNLLPEMITAKSGKDVWWKCKNGHSWQTKPLHRQRGGCPYCGGKKVLKGYNDLETLYPQVTQEWDWEKNNNKKPDQYTCGSNIVVYWKCAKCNESWKAPIYQRTKGSGCPKCSKKQGARKHAKKVMCVETGELFECVTDAAEKFSLDRRNISNCINGRQKTAGGFHWKNV